ncbi:hypothetical protein KUV57_13140 [Epibacterium sp. DP7N7-1]|nr:hypothetical protein [Epibacterium sp. DP7N7-1]
MSIELYLAAAAVCILIGLIGRIGLRMASDNEDMISWAKTLTPALLCGMPLAVLQSGFEWMEGGSQTFLCITSLGAALGVGAIIDRETGWAPDILMAVLAANGMLLGTIIAGWELSPIVASIVGIALLAVINLFWIAAVKLTGSCAILPPADILAFALPFMIFGISAQFVTVMLVIATVGLACKRVPSIAAIFTNPKVGEKIVREIESDDMKEGHGLTLLSIALPSTWLAIMIWLN